MTFSLSIGIVSENLVQQHYLKIIVDECQYSVVAAFQIRQVLPNVQQLSDISSQVDAWLIDVDLASASEQSAQFEQWLFNLEQPVIFGEGHTYNAAEDNFHSWSRQLKHKLLCLDGQLRAANQKQEKPTLIWVLAASTGGPEAIKRFLDKLPGQLDVGFVYAQHIDQYQNQRLAEMICRDSDYESYIPEHGEIIRSNGVALIPANYVTEIQQDGRVVAYHERSWRGDYRPSIDQVVANVADLYGRHSGAIFFTGMGDDGAIGSRLMALREGQVWIQSPATCASTSMPDAVDATGCVTTQGSPEQLADNLAHWVSQQHSSAGPSGL